MIRIAITPPRLTGQSAAHLAAAAEALLNVAGWDRVHLRFPEADARTTAAVIDLIDRELWPRLTLHSHQGVAASYGTGVQLNRRNRRLMVPRQYISSVSVSCHSINDVTEAQTNLTPDYVTLSPMFDSVSKPGYNSAFDLDSLSLDGITTPVIALGGITPAKVAGIAGAGMAGLAVLGSLPWDESIENIIVKAKQYNLCSNS